MRPTSKYSPKCCYSLDKDIGYLFSITSPSSGKLGHLPDPISISIMKFDALNAQANKWAEYLK